MDPHTDSLVDQIAYYERTRDHDNWTLLRYNCCICLVMLSEVDKILLRLLSRPNAQIQSNCRTECVEVLNKIVIATEGMMQSDDLTLMALLFKVNVVWKALLYQTHL
jgi:hypothetical protein